MTQPLSLEYLRSLLNYDPDTGVFAWRVTRSNVKAGMRAGGLMQHGYRTISVVRHRYYEHRLVWLYVHERWPTLDIDHINGNRADNRLANLREVTRRVNLENQWLARRDSKSGLRGVHWSASHKAFLAQLQVRGRNVYLGQFDTAEEAHQAYLDAKRKYQVVAA